MRYQHVIYANARTLDTCRFFNRNPCCCAKKERRIASFFKHFQHLLSQMNTPFFRLAARRFLDSAACARHVSERKRTLALRGHVFIVKLLKNYETRAVMTPRIAKAKSTDARPSMLGFYFTAVKISLVRTICLYLVYWYYSVSSETHYRTRHKEKQYVAQPYQ